MADTIIEQLRRTRDDHATELAAHRFLLEAFSGTGGFSPAMTAPPASWWGAAATDYATGTLWTRNDAAPRSYLDRFPREDTEKFAARVRVAHYENYVEPLTELKCSYVLREPFAVHDEPDEVSAWKQNVDGDETTWADWLPDVVTQAAVLGWTPILVDAPPVAEGLSRAQVGDVAPTLHPLFPSQLLEWSAKGKRFEWVKVRTDHVERLTWDAEPVRIERYAIWTPDTVEVHRIIVRPGQDPTHEVLGERAHGFGRVPIAILRHAAGGDSLRGRPMHWAVSQLNKRLFNLLSEMDEHMRSNVFALLVYPTKVVDGGEVDVGSQNGLLIDPEQRNTPEYISPDPAIAATIEARIEALVRAIYRVARVEFTRPSGAAVSGVAREYEFEQTNRALSDFAKCIARAESDVADLVGTQLGVAVERRRRQTIAPPRSFAVQDLERDIKVAMDAVTLKLGDTATARIRQHVVRRVLPNLTAADAAKIDEEIEQLAAEEQQARAMAQAALAQTDAPSDTQDEEREGSDDAVTDEQNAGQQPPQQRAA